jgi:hypothetical protein
MHGAPIKLSMAGSIRSTRWRSIYLNWVELSRVTDKIAWQKGHYPRKKEEIMLTGIIIGLFIGFILGYFMCSLMIAGKYSTAITEQACKHLKNL